MTALRTTDTLANHATKKAQRRGTPGDEVLKDTQEGEEEDPSTRTFSENLLSWCFGAGGMYGGEEFGIDL